MTDVMEVDERFMHIATLDTVVKYMQANDTESFVRKLVVKKKIAKKSDEDFELTAEQEALLLKAIEEADQGDFIDGDQLLKELDERV